MTSMTSCAASTRNSKNNATQNASMHHNSLPQKPKFWMLLKWCCRFYLYAHACVCVCVSEQTLQFAFSNFLFQFSLSKTIITFRIITHYLTASCHFISQIHHTKSRSCTLCHASTLSLAMPTTFILAILPTTSKPNTVITGAAQTTSETKHDNGGHCTNKWAQRNSHANFTWSFFLILSYMIFSSTFQHRIFIFQLSIHSTHSLNTAFFRFISIFCLAFHHTL